LPFLVQRDALGGAVFVVLLSLVAVLTLYRFAREYFGSGVALIAAWCFAVFPPAVITSRTLWNPGPLPLFVVLLMWALHALVINGRSRAVIGVLACLAVLTQLHASTVALAIVAVLVCDIHRPRVRWL